MSSAYVIGIDGGGTKTRALLANKEGCVLGFGQAGASNPNSMGLETAVSELGKAMEAAWRNAGLEPRPADALFLGMAGIQRPSDGVAIEERLSAAGRVQPGRVCCRNDTEAALAGGLSGRPGVVLIAGTGSFALARDAQGGTRSCGGWGWLLDDIGSGFHLGREALRAVLLAEDGRRRSTELTSAILRATGCACVGDLVPWLYSNTKYTPAISSLAPVLLETARAGDAAALEILEQGAAGLATLAATAASGLHWNPNPEVVLVGGVALSGDPSQTLIASHISKLLPGATVCAPELPPCAGSVIEALRRLGQALTPERISRLQEGCRKTPSLVAKV